MEEHAEDARRNLLVAIVGRGDGVPDNGFDVHTGDALVFVETGDQSIGSGGRLSFHHCSTHDEHTHEQPEEPSRGSGTEAWFSHGRYLQRRMESPPAGGPLVERQWDRDCVEG